jgi:transposase
MLDRSHEIFVYSGYVDMRKSINGLCILTHLSNHSFERGKAFVFFNKTLDKVKILSKEDNGFVLLYKRLDAGTFKISFSSKTEVSLTPQQLRYLLDGLDYVTLTLPKAQTPKHFF